MNLKDELIKLGSENPRLRRHLRPIIDKVASPNVPEDVRKHMVRKPSNVRNVLMNEMPKSVIDKHGNFFQSLPVIQDYTRIYPKDLYTNDQGHIVSVDTFEPGNNMNGSQPDVFIMKDVVSGHGRAFFLIDTQGGDYPRYAGYLGDSNPV